MIQQKRKGFSVFAMIAVSVWLMAYSLFMTERTMAAARTALHLFGESILPSLALFSVCAKLFLKTNVLQRISSSGVRAFLKPLDISAGGFSAFLVGLFAGFPTGAGMLADLCEKKVMSKREAESLLPFCNHAGAAFLIGTVGTALLGRAEMGTILFCAQTATAFCCLCLTSGGRQGIDESGAELRTANVTFFSALSSSVKESVFAMLGVCGFVVFFSMAVTALCDTLSAVGLLSNGLLFAMIGGLLEISFGFVSLSSLGLSAERVLMLGGLLLGFGGLSVFMQATERTELFFSSPKKYFYGKMLESAICPIFACFFFFIYEEKNGKISIIISLCFILCFFYLLNYLKIKFFSKKCGKLERNAV